MKKILKILVPEFILNLRYKYKNYLERKKFSKMNLKEVFKEIYINNLWSTDKNCKNRKFNSGLGSHSKEIIDEYINSVVLFLKDLKVKPDVVDLGCGDFNIGSKLRGYCNSYIAVDIFDDLIDHNKIEFKNLDVDFRVLDITKDELPEGDICFLRQVLQHLSNKSIMNFLKLLRNKYKYLILTEHYPEGKNLVPNIDKIDGADIRLYDNSAVVITEEPFNLKVKSKKILCEIKPKKIKNFLGTVKTHLYEFHQ